MRLRYRGFVIGIVGMIHRAERSFSPDAALELFSRFLGERFLEGIGAAAEQSRAREAKGGEEGFQALRIMGAAAQCKN